jgi:hypothetical protein
MFQMFGKPTRPFPPLPKKQIVGNLSEKVVEDRQRMLTVYLQVTTNQTDNTTSLTQQNLLRAIRRLCWTTKSSRAQARLSDL